MVLRRRFQGGAGEADLILLDGDTLVFVEVKQRSGSTPAEWSVTPDKQARLRSAALAYLAEVGEHERPVRFDVVAVQGDQIRHLPGAF